MENQFESEVFPRELSEIHARRVRLGLSGIGDAPPLAKTAAESGWRWSRLWSLFVAPEPGKALPKLRPTTRYGLVGLALSGGGIRSSSFCLGVLQILAKSGIHRTGLIAIKSRKLISAGRFRRVRHWWSAGIPAGPPGAKRFGTVAQIGMALPAQPAELITRPFLL